MSAVARSQQERIAADLVLRSGVFEKAPLLEKFFRYICDRYFEGQPDQIKEYCIAVEALGRSTDFDPKKDSIVRVEAHRLRRRLEEYYLGPGANDPVHIVIPNGQYRPHFVVKKEQANTDEPEPEAQAILPTAWTTVSITTGRRFSIWLARAGIVVICAAVAFVIWRMRHQPTAPAAWPTTPVTGEFRILTGYHGSPFTDRQGHTWAPDAYYSGGVSSMLPADRLIESQPDPHLLRSERTGRFRYDIPLERGTYELHLYFAETEYGRGNPKGGGDSTRTFQVRINAENKLDLFDPLAEAGAPNRLLVKVFKNVSPASDGKLHISFVPLQAAFLNALEILPTLPDRIHPVRIVAQASPVTDSDGRLWAADEYFVGGLQVCHHDVVSNSPEKMLYQGERYGNFSYHVPLAPGKYTLTLHFAETWFGTLASHNPTALGQRSFNVFANGIALLRNFDPAAEAGGGNRSVSKVFENLEPNAQGMLILEFVPVKNYAEVNAIEVVETE